MRKEASIILFHFTVANCCVFTYTCLLSYIRDTGFDGDLESVWDVVKGKLLDSLDAIKRESTLGSRVLKPKPPQGKPPLSLYAISERPQLYLLWSCFQKLEEEVSF